MDSSVTVHVTSPLEEQPRSFKAINFLIPLLVIVLGVGSGYLLAGKKQVDSPQTTKANTMIKTSQEAGTTDTKTFKDFATGTLEAGGINGEGTHHLTRPGGVSQTVYLISSLVDLDQFVGKKVEIYGQTIRAKSAGWLMDVGRLKVIE